MVFMQVAEMRSFVDAGRLLGVSASAVGKRVARLEQRLGVRLFHRSTRSLTLTEEGMLLLERSRRIVAEIEAAEVELSQRAEVPRGRLRVSLPLVSSLVLPVLADFMRAYPDVQLDLNFTDRLVDVIDEGFDAVVRTGSLSDSRLSARCLGNFRLVLVASPDYLAQRGTPVVPADLLDHACLHYRFPNSGKLEVWPLHRAENEAELELPVSMVCDNIETRLCFALRGLGIACLPTFSVTQALASGSLRTILDVHVERLIALNVVWPSGRSLPPKLRVFIDFLHAHLDARTAAAVDSLNNTLCPA
jgi:DNA-binding transcriptional LysR family regulator